MSVFHENMLIGASGQVAAGGISRSLRFNSSDSAYLSRTPASAGNRKTWTWSGWVKRGKLGISATLFASRPTSSPLAIFYFSDQDYLRFDTNSNSFGSFQTNAVFRDCSAWYHIVFAADSTQSTDTNRLKLYVNGVQQTFASATYPSQNTDGQINTATLHGIGAINPSTYTDYFDGYLANIHFIDGQALDPTSFTETDATTGQLIPKAYTGSYGTNGFHLEFSDNSGTTSTTLGKDSAGSNNWTPNNFSVASGSGNDSLVDVPTNGAQTDTGVGGEVRGNYCTLNPNDRIGTSTYPSTSAVLSNGNLDWSTIGQTGYGFVRGSIGMSSGKWYWEVTATNTGDTLVIGLARFDALSPVPTYPYLGQDSKSWGYVSSNGQKYTNDSGSSYGASYGANDVIGVAYDADNGTLTFYKNGTSQGQAYSSLTSGPYFAALSDFGGSGTTGCSATFNFGQRPFAYTAPSGFKALCTANLPAPLVTKPNTVFDVITYTGNGSTRTLPDSNSTPTSLAFGPNLLWFKSRSVVDSAPLFDSVRGTNKAVFSTGTTAEYTPPLNNGVTAFNSNGVNIGGYENINANNVTFVAWCWDAGSSTVTNTQGSITSQVRANASAGFSVVTYTGTGSQATIGHGLNAAPGLIIAKRRDSTSNWDVYHSSLGKDNTIFLNSTSAVIADSNHWGTSTPNSTVFGAIGAGAANNAANGSTQVAYCFAPVTGYSSFGSYTGNGSADGPFVYTGFRPRWIMVKCTQDIAGDVEQWVIKDTARSSYNEAFDNLYANLSNAEDDASGSAIDILSNGFKPRGSYGGINGSATYIYAAFAESPLNYSRAR